MKMTGKVFRFEDDVNTDYIISSKNKSKILDRKELASHLMEDIRPHFADELNVGDIIVAGENFGCGSSREHAPIAIKASGISCVIATTFARIFYRNAINIGLPILECPDASEKIQDGDQVEIDFNTGIIHNITKDEPYQALPFPDFIKNIIACGGLLNSLK